MRLKNKPWARPFLSEHPELIQSHGLDATLKRIKKKFRDVRLEIGCGKGDFLLSLAKRSPQVYFFGIERALTPVAIAGKKLLEHQVSNALLVFNDFAIVQEEIPAAFFDVIYLNFSDPWPKIRHAKRRLTAEFFVQVYARILKKNGLLIVKTDNENLYRFSKENLSRGDYNILSATEDYDGLDPSDAPTEYELAFRKEGVPIYRLIARKMTE